MRRVVLDASVVMKWFKPRDETLVTEARLLRQEYEAGTLRLAAPFQASPISTTVEAAKLPSSSPWAPWSRKTTR